MIPGLRGSLLSHDALSAKARPELPADLEAGSITRELDRLSIVLQREGGPAWSARMVFDRVAVPFCRALGFEVVPSGGDARFCGGWLCRDGAATAAVAAFGWGADPGTLWRDSVRQGIGAGVRWCYAFTGPAVRIFDARRTHSRRYAEFDIDALAGHAGTAAIGCHLLGSAGALDAAVVLSEQHRAVVRDSLQLGVHEALGHLTRAFAAAVGRRTPARTALLDESLVVVYRILFLLFAEARGLVPAWHPVFRESYTIEALRGPVEELPRPRGIWEALQAIARLAHRGCNAGALRVPPFNGRLFSPTHAPLADTLPLDDAAVRQAVLSLTTRRGRHGRERIAYADLGVEHLGGVYERVLDYEVQPGSGGAPALVGSGRRKATGTFYTPRSLTEYLVRRTLSPLVADATPDAVLALRVLDPAMGSGAFLVAACRYLAHAYESALVREGEASAADLSEADRAGFRRIVAQRCLFGVDLNPMAVQLARLSLWLATLAGGRPLTFFDSHLRAGNSLVGAAIADVRRRRSGGRLTVAPRPLFDETPLDSAVGAAVASQLALAEGPEDTIDQVRAKEALFARMQAADAPLGRWKAIADLWCAGWFGGARDLPRSAFEALIDSALGRPGLSPAAVDALLAPAKDPAARDRFFHWDLEFAEVFHAADGAPLSRPGFDAVLGNPPWEMLRGDSGDRLARERASGDGSRLTRFARGSGIYRLQGTGQANLYQMFTERALGLLREGGRLGLVLPSGFATDHGCAALRRQIMDGTTVDSFVSVENREGLFPIHRGLKFVLLTLEKSGRTTTLPLRAGIRSAADFDTLPEAGMDATSIPVSRRLIEQLSGEQLAIPELRTPLDARIAGRIACRIPVAGGQAGWHLRFGRELNATDDRRHFNDAGEGLPVIEGKQIRPFSVDVPASRHHITPDLVERVLGRRPFERSRLAYRDVASSTNRLTLIAAVLPAGVITTHTLFCLKEPLDEEAQQFIAGLFNSFVANYLVRLRVTTHVTVSIAERLPLPKPPRASRGFRVITDCARTLAQNPADLDAQAQLQAAAARLYGLDIEAFSHVLSTFPLVDEHVRAAALDAFIRTV